MKIIIKKLKIKFWNLNGNSGFLLVKVDKKKTPASNEIRNKNTGVLY